MGVFGLTDSQNYSDIADAIRSVTGGSDTYMPSEMAAAIESLGGINLQNYVLRPDAELVQTYTLDSLVVTDEGVTLPSYTTTATTTIAAANLSPTVSLNLSNYDYFIRERFLTIPVYSSTTKAKGYNDYSLGSCFYEVLNLPTSFWLRTDGTYHTARVNGVISAGATYRLLYWSSATATAVYTSSGYGCHQVVAAPTLSSATSLTPALTVKAPSLYFRGSTTYFTSATWANITDIRRQYIIQVYRAPKGNANIDGWGGDQQIKSIMSDIVNNNFTLT